MIISAAQFDALASFSKTRSPAAQDAARLVMVEGYSITDAAARAGVSPQSASNAVTLLTDRLEKCRRAAGIA
ncbi:MAG: hypothetical protein RBR77_04250 [Thauera sp.]|nr:hypothetical protein [Thauera sp.]